MGLVDVLFGRPLASDEDQGQRITPAQGIPTFEAVKQWRYKPFLLSGRPFEVETTVTVNFQLRSE
jgi:hypothetical protein